MNEVSNRALALFFLWMDRRGVPHERLVEGTPCRLEHLRDPRGRISWDDFAALSERFEAMVGGPSDLRAVGRMFFDPVALAPFKRLAGFVFHPRLFYRLGGPMVGPSLFTPISIAHEEPEPDRLAITIRVLPPYRDVPSFFHISAGNMESIPTLLGWPPAEVSLDLQPGLGRFDVRLAPRPANAWARGVGRVVRSLWSPDALFDELTALQEEVRRGLDEEQSARRRLAASEARWRAVAEAVGDTVALLDRDGVIREINRVAAGNPEDIVGRHVAVLTAPPDRAAVVAAVAEALEGRRRSVTVRVDPALGSDRYFAATFGPIVDEGRVTGVAIGAREVTAERAAEAARQELERRVTYAERFESLGLLAGGIAHDFNNLLAVVRGNAEIASAHVPTTSPARRALERIDAAAGRAAGLTSQLLTYAGRKAPSREPFDVSARVDAMRVLLQSVLPKSVRFETRLGEGLPRIEADPAQVEQVVMNLIVNAAESLGDRPGTVTIATRSVDLAPPATLRNELGVAVDPGSYVVVEVADTGPGIDPASRSRIFEPFFTTKSRGHGLGLAAVAGIVRSHRGAVEVVSTEGEGAVFRVYLPVRSTVEASSPVPETRVAAEARGGLVLVVDDESLLRETAQGILEQHGYTVVVAADGDEALRVWEGRRDDVTATVLDVAMPGRSGTEVCRLLRERDAGAVVVLTSAHAPAPDPDPRFAPDAFLSKPWAQGALVDAVRRAVATRSVVAQEPRGGT